MNFHSFIVRNHRYLRENRELSGTVMRQVNSLSLIISISIFISMFENVWSNTLNNKALVVVDNIIFTNSLIGATIQDGGKRKRSDALILSPKVRNK